MTRFFWGFVAAGTAPLLVGCIPDQGDPYVPDSAVDAAAEAMDMDMGPPSDAPPAEATTDATAASENVLVVGLQNKFWFTTEGKPTGTNPNTLYVKPNTLVHFTLQTSPAEEAHTFQIVIPSDPVHTSQASKMGVQPASILLDWTAPPTVATYLGGVICTVHADMKSDLIVGP